jgi:hypothetical protein
VAVTDAALVSPLRAVPLLRVGLARAGRRRGNRCLHQLGRQLLAEFVASLSPAECRFYRERLLACAAERDGPLGALDENLRLRVVGKFLRYLAGECAEAPPGHGAGQLECKNQFVFLIGSRSRAEGDISTATSKR